MPPSPMQSVDWFPRPKGPSGGHPLLASAGKAAVGIAVGALFYARGHVVLGGVAAGLAVVFFAASLSAAGRKLLAKVFGVVGEWAGRIVGTVLLTAIFVLVLTPVRIVRRIAGADDLRVRGHSERSFWLPCDSEEHKRKYAGAMFATEMPAESGGRRGVVLLVALAVLLLVGEIGLRIQGYGHPLTYLSNPSVGYLPAPGQRTTWRGAQLATNKLGMRAPEREATKAKGTLRILALATDGGLRVDQEALYARVAEKKLSEKGGGRAVEVWNADVEGWGTASARGFVQAFGTFDADAAVIVVTPGGLVRPKQSVLYTGFAPAERPPRLALEEELLRVLWEYRVAQTVDDAEYWETLRSEGIGACGALARTLRERGAEAIFVVLPSGDASEKASFAGLRATVEAEGGKLRELPDAFASAGIDPTTKGMTAAGHAALGEEIAKILVGESAKGRTWIDGRRP